jgi:hypothetical protein
VTPELLGTEILKSGPSRAARIGAIIVGACLVGLAAAAHPALAKPCPTTSYLRDYPASEPNWTERSQGVAHSPHYWWFTTSQGKDVENAQKLFGIPVGRDLTKDVDEDHPGQVRFRQWYNFQGYYHIGDLDRVGNFLFIPLEGPTDNRPDFSKTAIGVLRISDLHVMGVKHVDQPQAPWLAYNPHDRMLYSSAGSVGNGLALYRYGLDMDKIANGNVADGITFEQNAPAGADRPPLYEANGSSLSPFLTDLQGGAFTPWGDLYIVNGANGTDPSDDRGGVHLFHSPPTREEVLNPNPDSPDGRLIEESTNGGGSGFAYQYDADFFDSEEPEGADWWNRELPPSSPHIGGELHVMLSDLDVGTDDLYFKHYAVDYWCKKGLDSDGDGLEDQHEGYVLGTDPQNPDTDRDGLSDGFEVVFGLDPLSTDSDKDGIPDDQDLSALLILARNFPRKDFTNSDFAKKLMGVLKDANRAASRGRTSRAGKDLRRLRNRHLDGCGRDADANDWLVSCHARERLEDALAEFIPHLLGPR